MKPYKKLRNELEQRLSRKPKALKHITWTKATKRVAIHEYKFHHDTKDDARLWDIFLGTLQYELDKAHFSDCYGVFQCDVYELAPYFDMFKKCMAQLKKNEQKAEFLNKNYEPLESDLFEI